MQAGPRCLCYSSKDGVQKECVLHRRNRVEQVKLASRSAGFLTWKIIPFEKSVKYDHMDVSHLDRLCGRCVQIE